MKLYEEKNRRVFVALILGILSVLLWMIPLAGIIVSILCLFLAFSGLESKYSRISLAALILGVVGLILTILRSVLVYYL